MAGASLQDLQELQRLMVKGLTQRLEADITDNIPTDAATYGVLAKLLKDNDVRVAPADIDDLQVMRDKLTEQSRARRLKSSGMLELVKQDVKEACG